MNKTESQLEYVKKLLLNYGSVSRNHLLSEFISRGGAIIAKLKEEGFVIEGKYEKKNGGKDYVYELVSSPYKQVKYFVPNLNKEIIKYEKITTQS